MHRLAAIAYIVTLLPIGCTKGHTEEASPKIDDERDFVRYDPKHGPLDFVKIAIVEESSRTTSVALTGRVTLDENRTQRLASPIDGRAVRILVKQGEEVRAGQPVIQLSSPTVGQLQADAQKALTDLSISERSIERIHKLKAEGAVSDKEAAQAEGDYRKAKSDYGHATTQLKALGVTPTDPAVGVALRAQISGTVVERNILVGQEVRADQTTPLLTISGLDTMWVMADVYERDLSLVQEGDVVSISVSAYAGEVFQGVVKHIGEVVDPNTRTVKLRCVADNRGHRLKAEMFAKIEVSNHAGHKFVTVPSAAILNDGDRSLVIVANEGNVFRARQVEIGPEIEGQVRVLKGLVPGEKIVSTGAIFMKRQLQSQ